MSTTHEVMLYLLGQLAAYLLCWNAAARLMPHAPDRAFAADALYGVVYFPCLVVLASDATVRLGTNVDTRWVGTCASSRTLGRLLLSRMLVHVPFLFMKRRREDVVMRPMYCEWDRVSSTRLPSLRSETSVLTRPH